MGVSHIQYSLQITFSYDDDAGSWWADAPWLEAPVCGPSYLEAYKAAVRARAALL